MPHPLLEETLWSSRPWPHVLLVVSPGDSLLYHVRRVPKAPKSQGVVDGYSLQHVCNRCGLKCAAAGRLVELWVRRQRIEYVL